MRQIAYDYVGVEYNPSHKFKQQHWGKFPLSAYGSIDFALQEDVCIMAPASNLTDELIVWYNGDNEQAEHRLPNTYVSFEMIEHIEPNHCRRVLQKIRMMMLHCRSVTGDEPIAFISTPCWDPNVGAAGNHVNEMLYEALGGLMEDLGFVVEDVAGTFASQRDYKDQLIADGHLKTYEALASHYDSNYLATIFAPLYPQHSRNALWTLRVPREGLVYERKFKPLSEVPGPWTSSQLWEQLNMDLNIDVED